MSARTRWILTLSLALATSGCVSLFGQDQSETSGPSVRLVPKLPISRKDRWRKHMRQGPEGLARAMKLARSLVDRPDLGRRSSRLRDHIDAIVTVGLYLEEFGYDEWLDAAVTDYYKHAVTLDGAEAEANELKREMAHYYVRTGRRGLAKRMLAEADADEYTQTIAAWRVAAARGDLAGAEQAWVAAQALAPKFREITMTDGKGEQQYLGGALGLEASDEQLRERQGVLLERMLFLAASHDSPTGRIERDELVALWTEYERIGLRGGVAFEISESDEFTLGKLTFPVYRTYLHGARVFALAGDDTAARTTLRLARQAAADERSKLREFELACAEAHVDNQARRDAAALAAAKQCIRLAARAGRAPKLDTALVLGEIHERADLLDQAETFHRSVIADAERQRDSYPLEERTVFFRTAVRRGYWGLMRTLVRRSLRGGPDAVRDFEGALRASELVRARQLGELRVAEGKPLGTFTDLAALRAGLAADEALLQYVVMDREVLLFVITEKEHAVHFLPISADALAATIQAVAVALARPTSDPDALGRSLTILGRALLMPAWGILAERRRWIVLPDGAMNVIPLDLLGRNSEAYRPLVVDREIRIEPSLGLFLTPTRSVRPDEQALLGVADPAYDTAADPASKVATFPRLPETLTELEKIGAGFGRRTQLSGAAALESRVKAAPLREHDVLHFATHAILGREVPGVLEPALVLLPGGGDDGFLTATEAAALDLSARLTVLSACKTGAGDVSSGEGVLGMSRAFMAAGSDAVVVSLWSVDSESTVELMVEFYRRISAGEPPAAALRAAKLALRDHPSSPELGHPYFWGAFSYVGR